MDEMPDPFFSLVFRPLVQRKISPVDYSLRVLFCLSDLFFTRSFPPPVTKSSLDGGRVEVSLVMPAHFEVTKMIRKKIRQSFPLFEDLFPPDLFASLALCLHHHHSGLPSESYAE